MFPFVHGQVICLTLAGYMFRLVRGTQQHGLHDYAFLSSACSAGTVAGIDEIDANSYNESMINKGKCLSDMSTVDNVDFVAHTPPTRIRSSITTHVMSVEQESDMLNTYMYEDSLLSIKQKQQRQQSHEAFNYVADSRKTAYPGAADPNAPCVQLMCTIPPTRRCFQIFKKWRLEYVSKEELTTVWRMYLSCALLASANTGK
ncbi:hypothetical protein LPJ66_008490 [Kickxella alabastrina]|uniref:Uncharacterized protein n=1 Tax=Kickxella alabastrina TaxID=61397 RepID=A0ACC1I9R1_9FUNG|nr:hypothetical protein LPJ66_008490 [Kickxella alabastrina]